MTHRGVGILWLAALAALVAQAAFAFTVVEPWPSVVLPGFRSVPKVPEAPLTYEELQPRITVVDAAGAARVVPRSELLPQLSTPTRANALERLCPKSRSAAPLADPATVAGVLGAAAAGAKGLVFDWRAVRLRLPDLAVLGEGPPARTCRWTLE